MLDVLELEKQWSKYHFKKTLPVYITAFIIATAAAFASYIYMTNPEMLTTLFKKEKTIQVKPAVQAQKVEPVKELQIPETVKADEQNILVPSFNFIYNLEDQVINYNNAQKIAAISALKKKTVKAPKAKKYKKTKAKKYRKPAAKPKKKAPKPKKVVKKAPVIPKQKAAPAPTKKIIKREPAEAVIPKENNIQTQTLVQVGNDSASEDELKSVIKRFNRSKKPALSLFISKKYYEMGNYKESYNYAKATYKLNPNIEDGVLLYAKSVTKLGHSDKAVSKLKPYIKRSGSIKAKILLNDIQKGNFK